MHDRRRFSLVAGLAMAFLAADPRVAAGEMGKRTPAFDVKGATAKLESGDVGAMTSALLAASEAGPRAKALAPAVEDILKRGAPKEVLKAALGALAAFAAPSTSAIVRTYVQHRDPELRLSALRTLLATRGADAIAAFRQGLRASDPAVRATSAAALGEVAAKEAVGDLMTAFDRGVTEAAPSIGKLCNPEECRRFAASLNRAAFAAMAPALGGALLRDPPLPDADALAIVDRVRALGTAEARTYLAGLAARWPDKGSPVVKRAIEDAAADPSTPGAR
jgi:hypothetical protein